MVWAYGKNGLRKNFSKTKKSVADGSKTDRKEMKESGSTDKLPRRLEKTNAQDRYL